MNCEQFWSQQREEFLRQAGQAEGDSALLGLYQQLLERMKTNAMASCPGDDVLRQQTALLFAQAAQGAELYLARDLPTLERALPKERGKREAVLAIAARPAVQCAVLGAGLAFSLLAGKGMWRCAVFFAAGLALAAARFGLPVREEGPVSVRMKLRLDYLDEFIGRQARLFDAQMRDLRALLDDMIVPADMPMEQTELSLCQYVWAFANGQYPPESALYTAEKLLRANDLRWEDYDPARPQYYDVMPTKKASRTVYPALCKISDGTLVCKGQYLENPEKREEARL